jgi:sec-independent protein translocase protein TatA
MGRLGLPELLIILAIIIVIFGANRLPGLGRGIGSAIKNFKDEFKEKEDDKDKDEDKRNRRAS